MSRDLAVVLFSAVLAALNPSLLAATTMMLLLPNPKRLMLGYLLGAYTSSIVSGLVIVYSVHGSSLVKNANNLLSPTGDIALGAVALAGAFILATERDASLRRRRERRKAAKTSARPTTDPWRERMLVRGSAGITFTVGAAMSFPAIRSFSYRGGGTRTRDLRVMRGLDGGTQVRFCRAFVFLAEAESG